MEVRNPQGHYSCDGDLPYYAGTIINASEDVLSAFINDGAVRVPARKQQDLVALVKAVYAFRHPHCVPRIQHLAALVARDLASSTTAEARRTSVTDVRSFWDVELDQDSAAGRKWRELVKIAHVDELGAAVAYSDAVQMLQNELEVLL